MEKGLEMVEEGLGRMEEGRRGEMEVMWASGFAGRQHWQALLMGVAMRGRRRNERNIYLGGKVGL